MLEYFAYKKFKKNKAEKEAKGQLDTDQGNASPPTSPRSRRESAKLSTTSTALAIPLIDDEEQRFLERLTSSSSSTPFDNNPSDERPPLPPRVKTPDLTWDSDSESFRKTDDPDGNKQLLATKAKGKAAINRVTLFLRSKGGKSLDPSKLSVPGEVDREKDDLTRVLDDLNLAARNNKAFALSSESNELVRRFTLVLKDLVNGVPTAVNDLTSLLDDKDGTLSKNYEKLPSSMKKLVKQLPDKILGPELLAVAAQAQGLSTEQAAKDGGIKGAAKRLLVPKSLKELITKPGAVVSMLKGIMNALKLRWPAFIGTNVIWSLAVFLLLYVLWYCHKRGREVRLDRERSEGGGGGVVDGSGRIEELPDDPALPAPGEGGSSRRRRRRSSGSGSGKRRDSLTATPVIVEPPSPREGESSRRRRSHRRSGSGEGSGQRSRNY